MKRFLPVCLLFGLLVLSLSRLAGAIELETEWQEVVKESRGQTVYFNAWGGSDRINEYLSWVAAAVDDRYGITLKHVKIGDIAEVVGQLEAAKAVGRDADGNVDLMWVNGENFAAMKRSELIWGPFAEALPNAKLLKNSPSHSYDFSVPVEALESPWGGAQLVFIHDTAVLADPPRSADALLAFIKDGGRFAYPAPPAFHGTTMIKQLLHELTDDRDALAEAVGQANFDAVTQPLWRYLDELHPLLWGKGKSWPASGEATRQMLDDGELDIALSFNPKRKPALRCVAGNSRIPCAPMCSMPAPSATRTSLPYLTTRKQKPLRW